MVSMFFLALVGLVLYGVYSYASGLKVSIAKAKATGLSYVISPIPPDSIIWLMFHETFIPFIKKLPRTWWESWLPYKRPITSSILTNEDFRYTIPDWTWKLSYEQSFEKHQGVLVLAAPGYVHIFMADAEAIQQVTSRREAFPKFLKDYKNLDIFGRSVVSTEGVDWKEHRRVLAPAFNEKNNALVFAESANQARIMISRWLAVGDAPINDVPVDTMRAALHMISRIGFGVNLQWPGEEQCVNQGSKNTTNGSKLQGNRTMSFQDALHGFLENFFLAVLTPKWLLKRLPFKVTKVSWEAFLNWKQCMHEMFQQKMEEAREGKTTEGMDIMGSLIRSSHGDPSMQKHSGDTSTHGVLSDSDILGNSFVMILAGHETTANSIHFCMIELALKPASQRALQNEITSIFGDTPSESWDYESSINVLLGGMCGAVLNEQLRLMPPVIAIPKQVSNASDAAVTIKGSKYMLPAGSRLSLATAAAHRNPRYWPTQPSITTNLDNDLDDFKPERWLFKSTDDHDSASSNNSNDEFAEPSCDNPQIRLFRPVRGSYLPFSDGARACIGKRLAQVEMMAILAVIFHNCSVELAVDQWASDEEVSQMTRDEKIAVYEKAKESARAIMKTATARITLKLHPPGPTFIPVRVVRRGSERFIHLLQ